MRDQFRGRSYAAWMFWGTLLVGGTLYGAYRFDWFPLAFLHRTSTAEVAQESPAASDAPPASTSLNGQVEVAQSPVGPQTEPPPTEFEEPASVPAGSEARSTKARLLEQRAESTSSRLRANPTTPSTLESPIIEDTDLHRPAFGKSGQTANSEPQTDQPDHWADPPAARSARQPARSRQIVQTSHVVDDPSSSAVDPALAAQLNKIDQWLDAENSQPTTLLRAHRELSTIYWTKPQWRRDIQRRIDRTARAIYFDPQTHFLEPYVVRPKEQISQFASKFQVPWQYLAKLNRVDPQKIRAGQHLKVIKGPFSAVVELNRFLLTVHAYGYYVKAYPIGIGSDGPAPAGKFTVLQIASHPQYTDPQGRVLDAGDPQNPLGDRWIDLGNNYGIHGTSNPDSIGKQGARGCLRLRNDDVAELCELLAVGSEVAIRR